MNFIWIHFHHLSDDEFECKRIFFLLAKAQEIDIADGLADLADGPMFQDIPMNFNISDIDYFNDETGVETLLALIDKEHNRTMYGKTDIEVRYTMHLT